MVMTKHPAPAPAPAPAPEIQAEHLVLEADAASVLTRADEQHKMVWRGRAFALEDRGGRPANGDGERPFIARGRHAAGAGDMEDFGGRLKALAYRMGLRRALATAFIADGATCLWNWARQHLPPGTVLIQDFWRVVEHLSGLVYELWGDGEQAERKRKQWKQVLWESQLDEVLDDLRAEHKRRRGALRARLEREIGYLENGRERMDYARYWAAGWPVGSGAIEADCKHLVKERFNLTGARWRRTNIAPVLALCVAIFNEEWDRLWSQN